MLLDEITAALPADLSERVFNHRDRLARPVVAGVLFISHRMAEVTALCDRATVLRDGATVGVLPTQGRRRQDRRSDAGRRRREGGGATCRTAYGGARNAGPPALEVENLELWPCAKGVCFRSRAARCSASRRWKGRGRRSCLIVSLAFAAPTPASSGRTAVALKLRHPADAIRAGLVLVPANRLTLAAAATLDRERRARFLSRPR